jgi:hypothetical protein
MRVSTIERLEKRVQALDKAGSQIIVAVKGANGELRHLSNGKSVTDKERNRAARILVVDEEDALLWTKRSLLSSCPAS